MMINGPPLPLLSLDFDPGSARGDSDEVAVCRFCGREQDATLRTRLVEQDGEIRSLRACIEELKDTIRGLQKRPRRPQIKPSGLAKAGEQGVGQGGEPKRRRGRRQGGGRLSRRVVEVALTAVPEGAKRDGVEERVVRHVGAAGRGSDVSSGGVAHGARCSAGGADAAGRGHRQGAIWIGGQGAGDHPVSPMPVHGGAHCDVSQ